MFLYGQACPYLPFSYLSCSEILPNSFNTYSLPPLYHSAPTPVSQTLAVVIDAHQNQKLDFVVP